MPFWGVCVLEIVLEVVPYALIHILEMQYL
nr:MAG TPA: hypothetical protein [Bacteriophage sp.]